MSANTTTYLKLVARWLIDEEENDEDRDALWDEMTEQEHDAANAFVLAVFGEWV